MIPDRNACELLDADHLAVQHLFATYAQLVAAPAAPTFRDRTEVARQICEELKVHTQIEEEIFYPVLRAAAPEAVALLDEAAREHRQAKALIARIEARPKEGPTLDNLVAGLSRAVEHHVKEEREALFPKARSCEAIDLIALGLRLKERQQELLARLPT